tara:strand:+ start:374 stop:496 length:123 start_codon:yes stop_codon:yes gene_type:complete
MVGTIEGSPVDRSVKVGKGVGFKLGSFVGKSVKVGVDVGR